MTNVCFGMPVSRSREERHVVTGLKYPLQTANRGCFAPHAFLSTDVSSSVPEAGLSHRGLTTKNRLSPNRQIQLHNMDSP